MAEKRDGQEGQTVSEDVTSHCERMRGKRPEESSTLLNVFPSSETCRRIVRECRVKKKEEEEKRGRDEKREGRLEGGIKGKRGRPQRNLWSLEPSQE